MGSFARFLRLPFFEKACFLQAWLLLPLTALALRIVRLQRWQWLLDSMPGKGQATPGSHDPLQKAQAVARMVRAAARRLPFQPNCLERSVVLACLLERRGIPASVRMGSQLTGKQLQAHAWVECAGQILNDVDDIHLQYRPFERPAASEGVRSR